MRLERDDAMRALDQVSAGRRSLQVELARCGCDTDILMGKGPISGMATG